MSGYTLIGSESRKCQENGKWSGYNTICERGDGDCKNPGIPMNGRKQGQSYNRGDTVLYYCDSGFSLIGSRNRTCLTTGKWSGTQPTCRGQGDYDDPARVANTFGKVLDKFVEDTEAPESNGDSRGRTIDLNYGGRLEMYMAIDGSASVGRSNFLRAVKFAKTLVEKTGVSGRPKGPRYGALSYTDVLCDKFDVTIHDTKEGVFDELDAFKYPTEVGGTSTAAALEEIFNMIALADAKWERVDNIPGVQPPKRVLILMTDGASNTGGSPIDAAMELKRDYKVEIYVIGINVAERNDELYGIASTELPDEHIFILQNYHALDWLAEELVGQQIDYNACGVAGHTEPPQTRARISGGSDAIEGAWPWQVALWERKEDNFDPRGYSAGGFFCGGSIISSNWILTAAHCFYDNKKIQRIDQGLWHTKVLVGLGYTNLNDYELLHTRTMPITKIIPHPDYSKDYDYDYDIALMQLNTSIDFGNYIRPVCLPNRTKVSDIPVPKDEMVVTGWGETKNRSIGERPNDNNDALQQAYLDVVRWRTCENDIRQTQLDIGKPGAPFLTNNMFCVGNGYPSSCVGDSGGPVVKKIPASNDRDEHWVQFGIVSWGYGCGVVGQHDVMTNVTKLTNWIEQKTGIEL
ncbi:complement factor B-like [Anneissia japonica]|uniref:complement factor B-like n=1 Tax=Anneissia japonica TaxID=1529436 RepID=UPI001425AEB0|nr:complement factor B-like [Anneissia japonica]